ncbi:MAG: polysulfide reductase [Ferruginibacter sp.]|uniref:NrfD/PsrC family molybdoenzyme membrane anchor subunit n=1 Tax=Ferruginibacter sp. TaxID=1940288 RepID=UPI00265999BF|nr:NrfD/PsrC family molybdoenzyme membrane anchor subunit [Ferruginibacter sp.]MDB5275954.1 polysulfide reductase [Ferruginibacter sp.]
MENPQKFSPEKITSDLLPQPFGRRGKLWTAALLLVALIGAFAYIQQLRKGLVVTNMGDYVSWGIYISNFVFFVAISLVGSLITAIFRLADVPWRTPLTRISEIIAVSAITFAALIIIVDMGRPERMLYLFLHGRLQSPIMWDVIVISTYFCTSLLLLYITLLPDIKIMIAAREKLGTPFAKFYRWLGSFWKGTEAQEKMRDKSITLICIVIIPVAFCIHTVTSWLFATTYRPGWDSTNFGAYFVSGAFLVGAGGVVVAMYVFRRVYKLEHYITERHFDKMGKILVMLALLYLYFNVNEYLVPAFKMKKDEEAHLQALFTGDFAPLFWFAIIVGMIIPIFILVFPKGRKPNAMFAAGVMVVVGAWFKRYLIVTPTLLHPFLPKFDAPARYSHYFPSWQEWAITSGSLAGVLLIITFFARVFPIISIYKTITDHDSELPS